jgi:hypothetical protein
MKNLHYNLPCDIMSAEMRIRVPTKCRKTSKKAKETFSVTINFGIFNLSFFLITKLLSLEVKVFKGSKTKNLTAKNMF